MADQEEDIVQRVRIEGEEDLLQVFTRIGQAGSAAFKDIGASASRVGTTFSKLVTDTRAAYAAVEAGGASAEQALKRAEQSGSQFGTALRNLATQAKASFASVASAIAGVSRVPPLAAITDAFRNVFSQVRQVVTSAVTGIQSALSSINVRAFKGNLQEIEASARRFGGALREAASGIGSFVGRIALIGGGVAAAVAGFRSLAQAATGAAQAERVASRERRTAINDEKGTTQALANARLAANNAQDDLNRNLAKGKLTTEQYQEAMEDLRVQTEQNLKTIMIADAEEDNIRRRAVANMKRMREQEAFDAVADKVGNQAAGAFLRLGTVIEQVANRLKQTLGPVLAELVNGIATSIQQNLPKIIEFFNAIKAEIAPLAANMKQTFDQALPGILGFVQGAVAGIKIVVSALNGLLQVFNGIAAVINTVFGTNISGAAIAGAVAIAQFTGALSPLLLVVKAVGTGILLLVTTFGAIPVAIALIVAAIVGWLAYSGKLQAAWQGVGTFFSNLWDGIKQGAADVVAGIQMAWEGLLEWFAQLPEQITALAETLWNGIVEAANGAVDSIKAYWQEFVGWITDLFNQVKSAADALWNSLPEGLRNLLSGGGGDAAAAVGGFAGGGQVRGRGTGTSDSILAWLSNNEFVHRAAAVRKYGVGFMHAINNLTFPKDLIRGFADGGLVSLNPIIAPSPILRFADGGEVNAPRNALTLVLDGQSYGGLLAPDDVFESLKKHAVQKSLSPRKPNWF